MSLTGEIAYASRMIFGDLPINFEAISIPIANKKAGPFLTLPWQFDT